MSANNHRVGRQRIGLAADVTEAAAASATASSAAARKGPRFEHGRVNRLGKHEPQRLPPLAGEGLRAQRRSSLNKRLRTLYTVEIPSCSYQSLRRADHATSEQSAPSPLPPPSVGGGWI